MIEIRIIYESLPPLTAEWERTDFGAELVFHGIVRDMEADRPIKALYYEHYPEMAENELNGLAHEAFEKFDLIDLLCHHRVGEVAAGEASLRIIMRARHRSATLKAMEWFIKELKQRVPIWKWGVNPDGTRFPSQTK